MKISNDQSYKTTCSSSTKKNYRPTKNANSILIVSKLAQQYTVPALICNVYETIPSRPCTKTDADG
uniref:Uncharacterized protein n=1 Tax=Arundo donax TaxID=35708 RepID=A0A0A9CR57_ARUDO